MTLQAEFKTSPTADYDVRIKDGNVLVRVTEEILALRFMSPLRCCVKNGEERIELFSCTRRPRTLATDVVYGFTTMCDLRVIHTSKRVVGDVAYIRVDMLPADPERKLIRRPEVTWDSDE